MGCLGSKQLNASDSDLFTYEKPASTEDVTYVFRPSEEGPFIVKHDLNTSLITAENFVLSANNNSFSLKSVDKAVQADPRDSEWELTLLETRKQLRGLLHLSQRVSNTVCQLSLVSSQLQDELKKLKEHNNEQQQQQQQEQLSSSTSTLRLDATTAGGNVNSSSSEDSYFSLDDTPASDEGSREDDRAQDCSLQLPLSARLRHLCENAQLTPTLAINRHKQRNRMDFTRKNTVLASNAKLVLSESGNRLVTEKPVRAITTVAYALRDASSGGGGRWTYQVEETHDKFHAVFDRETGHFFADESRNASEKSESSL